MLLVEEGNSAGTRKITSSSMPGRQEPAPVSLQHQDGELVPAELPPELQEQPPTMSKRAANKLLHKQSKRLRRHDDRVKKHEELLEKAKELRKEISQDLPRLTVPDASLYQNLREFCETEILKGKEASIDEGYPHNHEESSDPSTAEGIVGAFLRRPTAYHAKYAAQELCLAYQVWRLIRAQEQRSCRGETGRASQAAARTTTTNGERTLQRPVDALVDVGAGNANLSLFLALLFDLPVLMVEMDSPRKELRGEECLPTDEGGDREDVDDQRGTLAREVRRNLIRVPDTRIEGYTLPSEYQSVIVIGKHLCGPGTDAAIEFIARNESRVAGCVFATCCFNKICNDHYFAECYGDLLLRNKKNTSVAEVEGRREDNFVCESVEAEDDSTGDHDATSAAISSIQIKQRIQELARMTSWRNTHLTDNSLISEPMLREAEFFESWIQQSRIHRLKQIFTASDVDEFLYCRSGAHSQQNRCLIAGTTSRAKRSHQNDQVESCDTQIQQTDAERVPAEDYLSTELPSFWQRIRHRAHFLSSILPIDLRPVGLVSARYNFDGRGLLKKAGKDLDICPTVAEVDEEDILDGSTASSLAEVVPST
ncbi:unnamed protein product [Amoebophrya sp. A120]|nr:unnamed protein product [Amoebophrya sp. A120]|eukprot:GSA120T00003804001.1